MQEYLPIFDPDTPLDTVARTMQGMGIGNCLMRQDEGIRLYSALDLSGLRGETIAQGSKGGADVAFSDLPLDEMYMTFENLGATRVGFIDMGPYGGRLHLVGGQVAYQCDGPPAHALFPKDVLNDRYCRRHGTVVTNF